MANFGVQSSTLILSIRFGLARQWKLRIRRSSRGPQCVGSDADRPLRGDAGRCASHRHSDCSDRRR